MKFAIYFLKKIGLDFSPTLLSTYGAGTKTKELVEEKSVAELLRDITLIGKERSEQESIEKQYLRELREITQEAERDPAEKAYREEIRGYLKQAKIKDEIKKQHSLAALSTLAKQQGIERGAEQQQKDTEIMRQEISPLETRAEKLIERYHKHEIRYHYLVDHGGSRFSTREAQDQMDRCAHDICHDKHAMEHLQKNDRELFREMNQLRERERVREMQKDMELSL